MYVIREIMHCKPGKVGEMVKRFKQMEPIMKEMGQASPVRVMTDMSGEQFWTVVWEQETANLRAIRRAWCARSMSRPAAAEDHDGVPRLRRVREARRSTRSSRPQPARRGSVER